MIQNQIASIVGPDNVVSDPEALAPYGAGNISFLPSRSPLMVSKPGTVEEVKALLRTAAKSGMPVTPSSSGINGHGGAIPSVPGMTIDLRRLSRIHVIDEISRNAVIEPGVTFAGLQEKVREQGLRVMVPVDLPAEASVLSSYLEMCPLYAWPKYGTEFILTLDMLLPDGILGQTGTAALPIFNEKPYMPVMTPPLYMEKIWFGAQGTFGIATKAAIKLKTLYESNEVQFVHFGSFAESLPAVKELKRLEIGVEFFLANGAYLAGMLAEDGPAYEVLKKELPPVTAVLILRGEQGRVDYQREDLRDFCAERGLPLSEALPGDAGAGEKLLAEMDLPQGYHRFEKMKGAYNVIPFICMAMQVPMFGQFFSQITQAFGYDRSNVGEMLLPVEPSRFHYQYSFYSNPADPSDHMKVKQLFDVWSSTLIKMGAFFSRPYGQWATQVYGKAGAYKNLVKHFKEVIDPNHIMNPGKLDL